MAWKLRQFFEGDTKLTIEAPTSSACWVSGSSYVSNSIAIAVDGVEHLLPAVGIGTGILNITVPSGILIKGTTTIKAYAVCETDPNSESLTLTAKPVNFSVYNSAITVCNPQSILVPYVHEYIRLFFTTTSGDYFNLKLSGTNMAVGSFTVQQGDTSNVTSTSGNFSRPGVAELIGTATANINYYNACTGVVASWVSTGVVRCNNCTEEREERDVNAQCTSNINRWVSNSGGGACVTTPNLTPTGITRCQNCVDEREMQDLNTCSSTYQAKSWVVNPIGVNCDVAPNWVDNGSFGCVNCIEKKQQIDNKPCSPTYNTTRYIDNPSGTNCNRTAAWTDLNEYTCVNCVEYKKQRDTATCSPTFNLTRDVTNPSGNYCDVNAIWIDTGLTRCNNGVHEKEQISSNACSEETDRWVASGAASCGCIAQIKIINKCDDGDYITGVEVYKSGVIEGNRLISFTNTVINFEADSGIFNYYARVTYNSTMKHTIKYNNYNCNPTI